MKILHAVLTLGGVGVFFGLLLGMAARFFAVPMDPRVESIREVLPGANCGACVFAGCNQYAEAIVEGAAPTNACIPGGSMTAEAIAAIMGEEAAEVKPKVAAVFCRGERRYAEELFIYEGISDCAYAQQYHGGFKTCSAGCLGLGNCVRACPFEAIFMGPGGLPWVDEDKCTGCGLCIEACPRGIIRLIPKVEGGHLIRCSSQERGRKVSRACEVGCTGCRVCLKACPREAITMVDNLAVIDLEKCDDCGICVEKCRFNAIEPRRESIVEDDGGPEAASA